VSVCVCVCVCGLGGLVISFMHIVQVFESNVPTHLSASILQILFHDEVHRIVKDHFQTNPSYDLSRESSVGQGLDRRIGVHFPVGATVFSLLHNIHAVSGPNPAFYTTGTGSCFPGGKAAGA
jgi:hypothetical protein